MDRDQRELHRAAAVGGPEDRERAWRADCRRGVHRVRWLWTDSRQPCGACGISVETERHAWTFDPDNRVWILRQDAVRGGWGWMDRDAWDQDHWGGE